MGAVSNGYRIREQATSAPDEVCLHFVATEGPPSDFTRADLDRRSQQLALALRDRGFGEGDRVGIGLHNSPEFVFAVFAAWKLGAVPVPMRWDLPEWELGRLTSAVDGRVQLGEDDLRWIAATSDIEPVELPDITAPHCHGICSSGSTGLPKVIVNNLPATFDENTGAPYALGLGLDIPRPQTVIVLGPMYHINGFGSLYSLLRGDRVVIMEKFDAARIVDAIERYRVTTWNCTTTMLKRIAEVPGIDDRDLSSIVWISQGAAPIPPYLVERWAELIGPRRFVMSYGMSEGLGLTCLTAADWQQHRGSVGRPLAGTQVRVLDDNRNDCAPGEIGEIFLRAPAQGGSTYLGGGKQATTTVDGYTSVGDLGSLDADGFVYVVDRRSDMIISGGVNIYPAEIEMALIDHPKIADIVVIGLKDEEWGRRAHALVQPADPDAPPTLEEIRAYAKERLHPYKVPKSLELVTEIPRSAATKVNRTALADARGG